MWASEVQIRLHGCIDLVAAEAVYHSKCLTQFMLNKELEQAIDSGSSRPDVALVQNVMSVA